MQVSYADEPTARHIDRRQRRADLALASLCVVLSVAVAVGLSMLITLLG
jgi:hypothetical protein